MEPAEGETKRDCWAVCFGNAYSSSERVVCAGYDNGDVKLFDLRSMSIRWETNIKNGVRIFARFFLWFKYLEFNLGLLFGI
jgi:hypothetical protein